MDGKCGYFYFGIMKHFLKVERLKSPNDVQIKKCRARQYMKIHKRLSSNISVNIIEEDEISKLA